MVDAWKSRSRRLAIWKTSTCFSSMAKALTIANRLKSSTNCLGKGWCWCSSCSILNNDLRTIASLPSSRLTRADTYSPDTARARTRALDFVIMSKRGLCNMLIVWCGADRKNSAHIKQK